MFHVKSDIKTVFKSHETIKMHLDKQNDKNPIYETNRFKSFPSVKVQNMHYALLIKTFLI